VTLDVCAFVLVRRNHQSQSLFALVVLLEEMAMERMVEEEVAMEEERMVEEEVAMEEERMVEEVAMEEERMVEETEVVEAGEAMDAAKAEVLGAEAAAAAAHSAAAAGWEGLYLLVCY